MVAQRISKLSVGVFGTWTKAGKTEGAFVLFDIIHEIAHCIATMATLDSSSSTETHISPPMASAYFADHGITTFMREVHAGRVQGERGYLIEAALGGLSRHDPIAGEVSPLLL
jgi:hypothetical protein